MARTWAAVVLGVAMAAPASAEQVAPDIVVDELKPGVWLYVATREDGIPSNGLLVKTPRGLLLVDTPWNDARTATLVDWAKRSLGQPVVAAISTHSHGDR